MAGAMVALSELMMACAMVAYSGSEMVAAKAEWMAYDEVVYSADRRDFVLVAVMVGVMVSNMAAETVARMDGKTVAHAAVVRES